MVCLIPITDNSCPKGVEIPAQGRDDKLGERDGTLGGRSGNIFKVMFLRFASILAIPALSRDLYFFGD